MPTYSSHGLVKPQKYHKIPPIIWLSILTYESLHIGAVVAVGGKTRYPPLFQSRVRKNTKISKGTPIRWLAILAFESGRFGALVLVGGKCVIPTHAIHELVKPPKYHKVHPISWRAILTFESIHYGDVVAMGGKRVISHPPQPSDQKTTKLLQDISYQSAIDFDFREWAFRSCTFGGRKTPYFPTTSFLGS